MDEDAINQLSELDFIRNRSLRRGFQSKKKTKKTGNWSLRTINKTAVTAAATTAPTTSINSIPTGFRSVSYCILFCFFVVDNSSKSPFSRLFVQPSVLHVLKWKLGSKCLKHLIRSIDYANCDRYSYRRRLMRCSLQAFKRWIWSPVCSCVTLHSSPRRFYNQKFIFEVKRER